MALPRGTAKTKTVLINGMELDGTPVKILTLQNFDPQNIDPQIFPLKVDPPTALPTGHPSTLSATKFSSAT